MRNESRRDWLIVIVDKSNQVDSCTKGWDGGGLMQCDG